MNYEINLQHSTNPIIRINHNGRVIISFSIQHLEKDRWDWLGELLVCQCSTLIEQIKNETRKEIRDQVKSALDL